MTVFQVLAFSTLVFTSACLPEADEDGASSAEPGTSEQSIDNPNPGVPLTPPSPVYLPKTPLASGSASGSCTARLANHVIQVRCALQLLGSDNEWHTVATSVVVQGAHSASASVGQQPCANLHLYRTAAFGRFLASDGNWTSWVSKTGPSSASGSKCL